LKRSISWIFGCTAAAAAFVATVAGCNSTSTVAPPPTHAAQSSGRTWYVTVGAQDPTEAFQGLEFYPSSITIDAGDSIVFTEVSGDFHVIGIPAAGTTPPPVTSPTICNPVGPPVTTYDGSSLVSSGCTAMGQQYTITFPKAGTYTVYCFIHPPEMTMTVNVQPAGAPYPETQAAYDAQAQGAEANDLSVAAASIGLFPFLPGGTHLAVGIAPGLASGAPANQTVLRFLDSPYLSSQILNRPQRPPFKRLDASTSLITVAVGTTVTWTNESNNEPHTITFPPAGQGEPSLPPDAPAQGGPTYDGTTLVNSGPLLPGQSFSLTFTKAGTYNYYCLFHDTLNMIGTVVVQ
jgi:plastocyanin